jgi:hypothetical protein
VLLPVEGVASSLTKRLVDVSVATVDEPAVLVPVAPVDEPAVLVSVKDDSRHAQYSQPCASTSKPFSQNILHTISSHSRALVVAKRANKTAERIPMEYIVVVLIIYFEKQLNRSQTSHLIHHRSNIIRWLYSHTDNI